MVAGCDGRALAVGVAGAGVIVARGVAVAVGMGVVEAIVSGRSVEPPISSGWG